MFHNSYQAGFLSILYSIGSKPLQIWDSKVRNGHVKRITDEDIQSSVLEILGSNVSTCYITCPANPKQTLGIKLPFLVMILKNMKKYFSFEVTVLDDKNMRRRFRASNYQSTTKVKPFICTMPMRLDEGWNQIQFNLSDFTRRAYGTNYVETLRVQVHANCRIRRLYFSDRLYAEEELPPEFKLFLPIAQQPPAEAGADQVDIEAAEMAEMGEAQDMGEGSVAQSANGAESFHSPPSNNASQPMNNGSPSNNASQRVSNGAPSNNASQPMNNGSPSNNASQSGGAPPAAAPAARGSNASQSATAAA